MQWSPRHGPILARGEDYQKRPTIEVRGRESPLHRIGRVIRQRPSQQIHWRRARVLNLNPIWEIPIRITQTLRIAGQKLTDDHRRLGPGQTGH